MNGSDAINGALAECTFNGYNFMSLTKFEAKVEKKTSEIPILGKTGKAHKSSGWNGTWSATAHYNTPIIREMLKDYKNGIDTPFEISVINEDESTTVGTQKVVLKQCLIDGGILALIDTEAEDLTEDISGTFDDFEIQENFSLLNGMK